MVVREITRADELRIQALIGKRTNEGALIVAAKPWQSDDRERCRILCHTGTEYVVAVMWLEDHVRFWGHYFTDFGKAAAKYVTIDD